jgi:SEC-C motif-containing protein
MKARDGMPDTGRVPSRRCPCGTGLPLPECCGRLHDGSATAATAEQLMRSRYSAFALGDVDYLLRTWYPTTRPSTLDLDPGVRWTGLDVLGTTAGSLLDREGTVEFRAHYVTDDRADAQHEHSRFVREGGRWRYLDGVSLG